MLCATVGAGKAKGKVTAGNTVWVPVAPHFTCSSVGLLEYQINNLSMSNALKVNCCVPHIGLLTVHTAGTPT